MRFRLQGLRRSFGRAAPATICVLALVAPPGQAQPAPSEYLGMQVGADRTLADWTQITSYLAELARQSDRVLVDTLGTTTLGRPFVLLTITAAENLARLDEIRESQLLLADPRRLRGPEHRDAVIRSAKNIVLITCSIHSTEVGSSQVPMRIAHRLAAGAGPEIDEILENTVVLLIPSLNPDGVDLVVDWYRSSLGTEWEGEGPPFLYHHYVGHDNNRDWYAFTQIETRLAVEQVHNAWHPQIVHDIHQQRPYGARLFIPPWIDPVEPNVDPLLVAAGNALGAEIAWDVLRQGKRGVVINAIYDAWTPARAYQHYHAGVRILSETASAKLATPLEVKPEELEGRRGFDPRETSWNFPVTWEGGTWRLQDIMNYMEAAAFSLLRHAARNRETWLRNFVAIGERAVAGWPSWPRAWVIPPAGHPERGEIGNEASADAWRSVGVTELVRVLLTGDVEVGRAVEPFRAAGRRFPAGSYVVGMRQPYAAFAQTLLERQRYPDLRDYDGGPLRRPYDVTAHTLPLLFGAEAVAVEQPVDVAVEPVDQAPRPAVALSDLAGFVGSAKTVGLYQPFDPSMDEGWTRWVFDRFGVPYTVLQNADLSGGGLEGVGSVLLASISAEELRTGREAGTVPEGLVGGLGEAAVGELERFVTTGGTLVAMNESVEWVIEEFDLPVRNVVQDMEAETFYAPGSLVRLVMEGGHPAAASLPSETAAWLEGGYAFEIAQDARVRVIGRYGNLSPARAVADSAEAGGGDAGAMHGAPHDDGLLLSGWLQGGEHIAGRPAIVDISRGEGRIILFGFRPQYRGQSLATLPLLFAALRL